MYLCSVERLYLSGDGVTRPWPTATDDAELAEADLLDRRRNVITSQ
jgi:hypothetical protein